MREDGGEWGSKGGENIMSTNLWTRMGCRTDWIWLHHKPVHVRAKTESWLCWVGWQLQTAQTGTGIDWTRPGDSTCRQLPRWGRQHQTGHQHQPGHVRPRQGVSLVGAHCSRGYCWATAQVGKCESWSWGQTRLDRVTTPVVLQVNWGRERVKMGLYQIVSTVTKHEPE